MASLVKQLLEAHDERYLRKFQSILQAVTLLIVGELGHVPLSPTGAELLFEKFSQRPECGSTIVTSNLPLARFRFTPAHTLLRRRSLRLRLV